MTVKELIDLLKTYPSEMVVARELYSEAVVVVPSDFEIKSCCAPRHDGWIHDYREDKESVEYLMMSGN